MLGVETGVRTGDTPEASTWGELGFARRVSLLEDELGSGLAQMRVVGRPAPRIGGRYVLEAILARGGFGLVVQARDVHLGRDIALKLVPLTGHEAGVIDHLAREGRALAQLDHPGVVRVFDTGVAEVEVAGDTGSCLFVAMELLDGITLADWMAMGPRGAEATLPLIVRVGHALAAVHGARMVHGDLKPQNLIVTRDRVVLIDFGLARVPDQLEAESGDELDRHAGTPEYMAPEVGLGAPSSFFSDQWSYAAMAWEVLTGARPRVLAGRVRLPRWWRVPRSLRASLRRGLALHPTQRHPDIGALVESLADWGREQIASRTRWRRRAILAAVGLFMAWTSPQWAEPVAGRIVAFGDAVDTLQSHFLASAPR